MKCPGFVKGAVSNRQQQKHRGKQNPGSMVLGPGHEGCSTDPDSVVLIFAGLVCTLAIAALSDLDGRDEAITPAGKSFNIGWPVRIIAEGRADLLNAEIQTFVEIDKSFLAPDVLANFFARDNLTRATR